MLKQSGSKRATGWPDARSTGVALLTTLLAVVGVTAAVSGGAVALQSDGDPLDSGTVYYAGQDVVVDGLDASESYRVRALNDDDEPGRLQRVPSNDAGTIEFTLDGTLSGGDFVIVNESGFVVPVDQGTAQTPLNPSASNTKSADFEVITQDLSAEFADQSTGNDGSAATVEYEISSAVRNDYAVNVSADGLDVADLTDIFGDANIAQEYDDEDTVTLGTTAEGTYELSFTNVTAGTYTFEASVTDADASDADTIEVRDTGEASADFAENVYTDQVGDEVEIAIEMENTDTATVQFGDPDDSGYHVTAQVGDNDGDGEAVVSFDTETAGSDQQVLSASDGDAVTNVTQGDPFDGTSEPAGSDILDAGDYDLYVAAGEKSGDQITDADARATLSLRAAEEPQSAEFGQNVYTADRGDMGKITVDFENTNTSTVQIGDPDDSGYYVTGRIYDRDGDGEAVVTFDSETAGSDQQVLSAAGADAVTNVTQGGPFDGTNEPAGSDTLAAADYDLYVTAGEKSSDQVVDPDARATLSLTEADSEASLDNEGDTLTVQNAPDQTISGTTNLDAGTELVVKIDSEERTDPFLFQPEATVQDDGSFAVSQDFSDADAGTEFEVTVLDGDTELTTADGTVTDDGTTLDSESLTVQNAPEQTISGTTSVEPGTEFELELDSTTATDPFVKRPEATVQDDGSFSATANFANNEPGTEFEVTVLDGDTELTTADGEVVGEDTETNDSEQNDQTDDSEQNDQTNDSEQNDDNSQNDQTAESGALSMTATSNPTLDGTVRVQFTVENTGGEAAAVTVNASDVVAPDALSLSNHSSDGGVWRASAQTWLFQNVEPGQSVTAAVDVAVGANASEQTVTGTANGNGQEVSATATVDRDGLATVQAVDSNDDDELDDSEVVHAINSWRNDDPVGDSNETITNEEIREIISLWEQGGD